MGWGIAQEEGAVCAKAPRCERSCVFGDMVRDGQVSKSPWKLCQGDFRVLSRNVSWADFHFRKNFPVPGGDRWEEAETQAREVSLGAVI